MSVRTWRHRDGGRVVHLFGDHWQIEIVWARRRRDRYGVLNPFSVEMRRWPKNPGRDTSAADVDGAEQSLGRHESVGERQGRQPAPERTASSGSTFTLR